MAKDEEELKHFIRFAEFIKAYVKYNIVMARMASWVYGKRAL